MKAPRPIRLPDRFYLPRGDGAGRELHDVMPWEGAVAYATDGRRIGVQYADGTVVWIGEGPVLADSERVSFADDFAGVNLDALLQGLREYVGRHPILEPLWREDLQELESLRHHGEAASSAD